MSLTSFVFFVFLAASVTIYYLIPRRMQWGWLLIVSICFYLAASPRFALFLGFSIVSTYAVCIKMGNLNRRADQNSERVVRKKKALLLGALASNLGVLLFLKYGNFVYRLARPDALPLKLILPLGISFYTLQVIGYCIDVYRAKYEPEQNLLKYALFVSFFPHIVQGPIARFDALAGQLFQSRRFCFVQVRAGFQLLLWGLFKKMVVADRANILVSHVFSNDPRFGGLEIYIAVVFYAMQLYADFSGCVDIARGAAGMLGIDLSNNFNHPYFAQSIQDFWKRWHISLSSWLRDYLYIPLGGNRKGTVRKYWNVCIVFAVSGFWHGAGFTYLAWGILHGLYQIIGALLMPARDWITQKLQTNRASFSHRLFKGLATFHLVGFAWIFFRAGSMGQALRMIRYLFTQYNPWVLFDGSLYRMGLDRADFGLCVLGFILMLIVSLMQEKMRLREKLAEQGMGFQFLITAGAAFAVVFLGVYGPGYQAADFIYAAF